MLDERSSPEQTSPGILNPEEVLLKVADDVEGFLYQPVSAHKIAWPTSRTSTTVISAARGAPYAIKMPRWIASVVPCKNIGLYARLELI